MPYQLSQGSKIEFGKVSGNTVTFTKLVGVTTFDLPNPTRSTIDGTDLDSTAVEYLTGLPDFGDASVTYNFVSGSTQANLINGYAATGEEIQVRYSIGTSNAFVQTYRAALTGHELGVSVNDKIEATITLQISGKVPA